MFISGERVNESDHEIWFSNSLNDSYKKFYIGEIGPIKIGVCRFEFIPEKMLTEISININPANRGAGHGKALLISSIEKYRELNSFPLHATIKKINTASISCFLYCGFTLSGKDQVNFYFMREE
jgi:RimJ/RimL family protein N-acetyltransferase